MQGRNFFLTGCASGMGRHMTGVLTRLGHRVFATDVRMSALRAEADRLGWPTDRVVLRELDVRSADGWTAAFDQAVAEFGAIDVLINFAGILESAWAIDASVDQIQRHLDINVKGLILGTQTAARHMIERRQGHIINLASMAGVVPIPGLSVYCASKYAVRGFSMAASQELAEKNVAVTIVCPHAVSTPMIDNQRGVESAAIMYSSDQLLTVEDIERVLIKRVLVKKPLIVMIPRHMGVLARLIDLFPSLGRLLREQYERRGRANQHRHSDQRALAELGP